MVGFGRRRNFVLQLQEKYVFFAAYFSTFPVSSYIMSNGKITGKELERIRVNQYTGKSATRVNIISQQYFQIVKPRTTIHTMFSATSQNI
jgi:hypothetical protein